MTSDDAATEADGAILLKVLLRQRHIQGHAAFCREYDKVAAKIEPELRRSWPKKAQFYRWLAGDLTRLPYGDHCRILEAMFPEWSAEQLFQPYIGSFAYVPRPTDGAVKQLPAPSSEAPPQLCAPPEFVALYAHRADTPKELWLNLLRGATKHIDLFANASLFLPEDNPEAISLLKAKAAEGVAIRVLMGDPKAPAAALRGREERLFDGLVGRIQMALSYYRPLLGVEGVQFRLHGTSLYNSIFRYDDQMLVNQHIYGTYGYIAPILHLRKTAGADMFDTYMRSLELVWNEESVEYTG